MVILIILKVLLFILALAAFLLVILGTPVGLVLLAVYIFNKKKRSNKLGKWIIILLCGTPLIIFTFILWAVFNLIAVLFGLTPLSTNLIN